MKNSLRLSNWEDMTLSKWRPERQNTIADGQLKEEDDRRPLNKINRPAPGKKPRRAARPLLLLGRIIRSSQSDTGTPSAGRGICWKTSITLRSATRLVKVNCFVTRENCRAAVCGTCCCPSMHSCHSHASTHNHSNRISVYPKFLLILSASSRSLSQSDSSSLVGRRTARSI